MKRGKCYPRARNSLEECGISASEQRNSLSYARSRPATTVIRRLDKKDDGAAKSTALTNNNVRITKDS